MSNYTIEQFVKHSNQYEPMQDGEFDSEPAALSAMRDLAENCGFTNMRVVNSDGEVIAFDAEPATLSALRNLAENNQ